MSPVSSISTKILVLVIVLIVLLGGLGIYYLTQRQPSEGAGTRVIVDFEGREVKIPSEVKRAVVLEGYEIVYALKAWDKVVGISKYAKSNPVLVAADKEHNLDLSGLPSPGSSFNVNLEELVKEKPDVVIAYSSKQMKEILPKLEELGIPVVLISLSDLDDLYDYIKLLGEIFHAEDRAKYLIERINSTLELVTSKTATIPEGSKLKMIHLWSKKNKVTGGLGVTNTFIKLAGCVNPASHLNEKYAEVSLEEITSWNPDVIIIWGWAKYSPQDILGDPAWQGINAVKNGKVYKYPKVGTWSPAAPLIVLKMAMCAYPEKFSDVNFDKVCDDFFMDVYGIHCPFKW